MSVKQDLFVSHATADKERYILPLTSALFNRGVTFWLDSFEIGWGDNFIVKINDGLRNSRFGLLCLSKNFLGRQWPETEMAAVLAIQNTNGIKKVLPLILNSKAKIFKIYPILAGFSYREFKIGIDTIAEELATLTKQENKNTTGLFRIVVESVHSAKLSNLQASPRSSVKWLAEKARTGAGVKDSANIGALEKFPIRWVLVDVNAEDAWEDTPITEKLRTKALVKCGSVLKYSYRYDDRLEDTGVYDGIIFHLYAVQDTKDDKDEYRGGGGGRGVAWR